MLSYVRTAVDAALDGERPLDPATADSLVMFAARNGDARLFERFLTASKRATSPEDRHRYLMALTAFETPALVERALEHSLTPDVRGQDVANFLANALGNPQIGARAWAFIKSHWTELEPKALNFLGGANIGSALGAFCDARSRGDIDAFFKTHRLPGGERALRQSIERIDRCMALKQSQSGQLAKWLASR